MVSGGYELLGVDTGSFGWLRVSMGWQCVVMGGLLGGNRLLQVLQVVIGGYGVVTDGYRWL